VGFLTALVALLLVARAKGASLRWPSRVLRLADGITISQPGSKGTDWRVRGVLGLERGGFSQLELSDKHEAETLERGAAVPRGNPNGDRYYTRVPVRKRFLTARGGTADFIVRVRLNAMQLAMLRCKLLDFIGYSSRLPLA